MKNFFQKQYYRAILLNHTNILSLLDRNRTAKFLDLGCDNGILTLQLATAIGTKHIYGVDIVPDRILLCRKKGIITVKNDLNKKLSFPNSSFDVIHANQVIEHLYDSDTFLSEIYRILKKGGYAIISTENASSWCNIFASIFGWQIFSLTNFSRIKLGLGNPLSFFRDSDSHQSSWNHVRIYNIRGLREYLEVCGFRILSVKGAGYFPLSAIFGILDTTHSHFITFKISKI